MPSRQDQLHSYQYSLQRVVAALVTHDPDPHRSPLRRAGTTALISVVVAALAVTGAAVWGILTGAGTDKIDDESAVYMDKTTGARYVFFKADGRLHPVLNYASGLLIANADGPNVVGASSKSLARVPLGATLGIPGAPDLLPDSDDLVTAAWSVCTQASADASATSTTPPRSTLLVGTPVTDGTVATARQALLVAAPGVTTDAHGAIVRQTYLVSGNRKFSIPAAGYSAILRAFHWGNPQPWTVAEAWLNAIPQGPDLAAPRIDRVGGRSAVPGAQLGQLVTDNAGWAVAMADGVAGVTDVQAKLLLTNPGEPDPLPLKAAEFNTLHSSATQLSSQADPNGLPATLPGDLTFPQRTACLTLPVGRDGAGVRLDPTVPAGIATDPGPGHADAVVVPLGKGALVEGAASPTAPAGTGPVGVVTGTGRLYQFRDRDLLSRMGYGGVSPVPVSTQLTGLLITGPVLDADKARQPYSP